MYKKIIRHCAALSTRHVIAYALILTIFFEAFTIGFRFGLSFQSTRDTAVIGLYTFGLRIHHGYIGLFLLPLAWCAPLGLRHALWILAIGVVLSDLIHHFLILWPITGDPQFDLVYPGHPYWSNAKP